MTNLPIYSRRECVSENNMAEKHTHPEAIADAHADQRAWVFVLLFTAASWFVLSVSLADDATRAGFQPGLEPWLREGASHIASLIGFLIVPFMLSRFPVSLQSWKTSLPAHILASIAFSIIHTLIMVALRKISYPPLVGYAYEFGLADPSIWLYEYRKDAYSYVLVVTFFAVSRTMEQRRLEAQAARSDARKEGRLTLKSGGRTLFLNAEDVIYAAAASNYVEITTQHGTHLARMTLSSLERLLAETGTNHIRVHRSYIVHGDHIQEIIPTRDGNVTIQLDNGVTLTGSRGYRDRLPGEVQHA